MFNFLFISSIIEIVEYEVMKMEYLERPKYIKQIEKFIDKPVIKILTGMRRVGKSTILMMIKDKLLTAIPDQQKIYINFESLEFMHINDAQLLAKYVLFF